MRAAAVEADRDPDAIEITAPTAAIFAEDAAVQVERWTGEMGVDRVIVPTLSFDIEGVKTALGQFGEKVIAKTA
jgi:hypothetical protein